MGIIAVDFDGVIHDPFHRQKGYKMGIPIPGAVEAVQQLYEAGNEIIVFTVRARNVDNIEHIAKWLDYFLIPYHYITALKPDADVFIDNKAISFSSWDKTLDILL